MLDLTLSVEALSTRLKPKTRYNVRLAGRHGVEVVAGGLADLPEFHRLLAETGLRDGFAVRPMGYYRDTLECLGAHGWLLLAYYLGLPLAALIVGVFGHQAIYLYGASSSRHRNLMSSYLLQWSAILKAKEAGCTLYDMWGVPPELFSPEVEETAVAAEHQGGLWGVYRFKRGFGGHLVSYPGAFDYVYDPLRYWLWYRLVPRYQSLLRRTTGMGV
jgi:lipid II:glycine glycyltransferase (peptidoglycan interpeptide bridge formation enzyme)